MEILVVGTGRDGTVSFTKWFNDLFEANNIHKSAVHEFKAAECYNAFDHYCQTKNKDKIKQIVSDCVTSSCDVIVGNGYASLLPYFAELNPSGTLIHLKRSKNECIESLIKNANYYPTAYKYYMPDELIDSSEVIYRVAAFQVESVSKDEWASWNLEKKLAWYYDYTHNTISNNKNKFANYMEISTEELSNDEKMAELANTLFKNIKTIKKAPKLNSHQFVDIDTFEKDYHRYAQWLLGNIDWQRVATEPAYFVTYVMNSFETWIGWCVRQELVVDAICPKNNMDLDQIRKTLETTIPVLQKSINNLKGALGPRKKVPMLKRIPIKILRVFGRFFA